MAKEGASTKGKGKKQEKGKEETEKHEEHGYEFGGPPGAFLTMLALPFVLYFLYFSATK